ncbi:MAG: translation elongation factor Ts, partial [Coriobacteriia bacterium]|nr:translation elongation factor Ts [Coriobacteriia bacterium]
MSFTAKDVQNLREATGAGMMDCKKALGESGGDVEKAIAWLREKGMAKAAKRGGRVAAEGAVYAYIHMGGKYGVLAEINCETDFVARGDEFQQLCKDICLHICSANPRWVRREEVPADAIAAEKEIYVKQAAETGKPQN